MKQFLDVDNVCITNKETWETKKIDVSEISVDIASNEDRTSACYSKGIEGYFDVKTND